MATSTEATVRSTIVAAIRGIAVSGLGFDESGGNVKDYPLDVEHPENLQDYLRARVGNTFVARCWSVEAKAVEAYLAQGDVGMLTRLYTVNLSAYYERGVGGAGYRTLIDHARAVREAIYLLGTGLSGTVSRVLSISPLTISVRGFGADQLLVGEFSYEFERRSPDW